MHTMERGMIASFLTVDQFLDHGVLPTARRSDHEEKGPTEKASWPKPIVTPPGNHKSGLDLAGEGKQARPSETNSRLCSTVSPRILGKTRANMSPQKLTLLPESLSGQDRTFRKRLHCGKGSKDNPSGTSQHPYHVLMLAWSPGIRLTAGTGFSWNRWQVLDVTRFLSGQPPIMGGADTYTPSRRSQPSPPRQPLSVQSSFRSRVQHVTGLRKEACAPCSTVHVHTLGGYGSQDLLPTGAMLSRRPSKAVFDTEKLDVPV